MCTAEGYNSLCGDKVTVHVEVVDDVLHDISFEGAGCAISIASASLMTEAVKQKSRAEITRLCERFHELVTKGPSADAAAALGTLVAFAGVREFPSRIKCALLAWQTLQAALQESGAAASTK